MRIALGGKGGERRTEAEYYHVDGDDGALSVIRSAWLANCCWRLEPAGALV